MHKSDKEAFEEWFSLVSQFIKNPTEVREHMKAAWDAAIRYETTRSER